MGLITNLSTLAFNASVAITVGGLAINVLVSLIQATGNYVPPQVLSTIHHITLFNLLFGLINNPFLNVAVSSVTAVGIVSLVASFSLTLQTYIQQAILAIYVFTVFANSSFFFIWVTTLANQSNLPIATDVDVIVAMIESVMTILGIIYYLQSIGMFPTSI